MYDTAEEASQKLRHTVVMVGPEPIFVEQIGGTAPSSLVISGYELPISSGASLQTLPLKSIEVQTLGERLGYVNFSMGPLSTSVYSRRAALRKSHSTQGLSNSNVFIDRTKDYGKYGMSPKLYGFTDLCRLGMKDTLQQKFPTLAGARYKFNRNENLLALGFDKNLALFRDGKDLFKLEYKGQEIGWTEDLEVFRIEKAWRYLDELFEIKKVKVR